VSMDQEPPGLPGGPAYWTMAGIPLNMVCM